MYDTVLYNRYILGVTGPCEFLVMYDCKGLTAIGSPVTGPCEFLVMYDNWQI